MGHRPRDNAWSNVVFGLALLAFGTIFWLDHLGRIEARDYLPWWPVVFVAIGLAQLPQRQFVGGAIWLLAGVWLLLPRLGYATVPFWRIVGVWPLLLTAAGVTLVLQALRSSRRPGGMRALAVLGGNVRRLGWQEFGGAEVVAVMGGCEVDLSSTQLRGEATVDVLAFWGGIEIRIPRGWRVTSRTTTILGGFTDLTDGGMAGGPQLVIRGSVIMGGLEVRNATEGRS